MKNSNSNHTEPACDEVVLTDSVLEKMNDSLSDEYFEKDLPSDEALDETMVDQEALAPATAQPELEAGMEQTAATEESNLEGNGATPEEDTALEATIDEGNQDPQAYWIEEALPEPAVASRRRPWWKRLWRHDLSQENDVETQPAIEQKELPTADAISITQILTPHEVKALVQAELAQIQIDVEQLVQAELERKQAERRVAALAKVREVVEGVYMTKAELFRVEIKTLDEEGQQTLRNVDQPLRERMATADYIYDRITQIEQGIGQVEVAITRQYQSDTEKDSFSAEAVGQELKLQKQVISALPEMIQNAIEARLAALPKPKMLGLWTILLALLLVTVVGLAGILLPFNGNGDMYAELAALYQTQGKTKEAEAMLDQGQKQGYASAAAWAKAGETYRLLKKYDQAIATYDQAVQMDPQNSDYLMGLARSYGNAGRHQEAILSYQNAIKTASTPNAWIYIEMGARYTSLQAYDEAMKQFDRALELNPNNASAHYWRGVVFNAQGEYDQAEAEFQKSLDLNANNYWAYINLGQSYINLGNIEAAVAQLEQATTINPEQADAFYWLGEAYRTGGQYDKAVKAYNQAIEFNPQSALYPYALGETYRGQADCGQALVAYQRALALNPNHAEAQSGLEACRQ